MNTQWLVLGAMVVVWALSWAMTVREYQIEGIGLPDRNAILISLLLSGGVMIAVWWIIVRIFY